MAEIIQEKMSIYEKLQILTDAAKYDVACTSSGVSNTDSLKRSPPCTIR